MRRGALGEVRVIAVGRDEGARQPFEARDVRLRADRARHPRRRRRSTPRTTSGFGDRRGDEPPEAAATHRAASGGWPTPSAASYNGAPKKRGRSRLRRVMRRHQPRTPAFARSSESRRVHASDARSGRGPGVRRRAIGPDRAPGSVKRRVTLRLSRSVNAAVARRPLVRAERVDGRKARFCRAFVRLGTIRAPHGGGCPSPFGRALTRPRFQ